jgi:hypothetical protein
MSKKLCKKDKNKEIKAAKAKYECKKCGLQAKKEEKLCKPVKL